MIYFKKNDKEIKKYEVSFDRKKVEKLKKEIIDKCSLIEHKEYESDYAPYDYTYIKNFAEPVAVGEMEYDTEIRTVYLYSYDLIIPPQLVKLIDRLLNGSESALDDIKNYDTSIKDELGEQIKKKSEEFDNIPNENIKERLAKLEEINELLKKQKLNINCQPIEPYYNRLLALITEELVDSIPLQDVERVESFLNVDLTKDIEKEEPQKKLKK